MRIPDASTVANIITRLVGDIYSARHHFVYDDTDKLLLSYRIAVLPSSDDDGDADDDMTLYVHVVIDRDGDIWYTLSEAPEYATPHSELINWDDDSNHSVRGHSYRRYIINDCIRPAVEDTLTTMAASIGDLHCAYYLWGSLPICKFNP